MYHLSKKWTLKSLSIGPQLHRTTTPFWEEALKGLPPLPHVDNVTIVHHYTAKTDCWGSFDRILSRQDLFPTLKTIWVQPSIGQLHFGNERWWHISCSFRRTRSRGLRICKLLVFMRDRRTDSHYGTQLNSKLATDNTRSNGRLLMYGRDNGYVHV